MNSEAGSTGDLFDLLGEDGEQFRQPASASAKPEDTGPTEAAKKKAEELKVDLAEVKGTGQGGRITVGNVQKVATEKAREQSKKAASTAAAKKEPDVYDKDRSVHYAGHRIEVPSREMKLEGVREMLEEQFPELSKERTEMLYDDEKGLVIPVLKGHRKGSKKRQPLAVHRDIPENPEKRPVFLILGADGVYEVRTTQAGSFVAKIESARPVKEGMHLSVPKIPVELLKIAVDRFKEFPRHEQLVNFIYDFGTGFYEVGIPEQEGSWTSVDARGTKETEKRFIVLQLHSHGTMRAFFSGTDDIDEVRTGLYGVIGRCHDDVPEMMLRYSCGGKYRRILPPAVFDLPPAVFEDDVFGIVSVRSSGASLISLGGGAL